MLCVFYLPGTMGTTGTYTPSTADSGHWLHVTGQRTLTSCRLSVVRKGLYHLFLRYSLAGICFFLLKCFAYDHVK